MSSMDITIAVVIAAFIAITVYLNIKFAKFSKEEQNKTKNN